MDMRRQASFITGLSAPTADERTWGMLAHLSAPLVALLSVGTLAFVGPLLVLALKGRDSTWVEWHAKRALNFHLVACAVIWLCSLTCFLLPVAIVVALIAAAFSIHAGLKAHEAVVYRYPIDVKLVK